MDTAWIQVFVLTIAECVAPAGKTVCQEQELTMQFLSEADCKVALQQLLDLKEESESVIVDHAASRCAPSGRQATTFPTLDDINDANRDTLGWQSPSENGETDDMLAATHAERLANTNTCEETDGVAPCRMGDIILEGADIRSVEVWRRSE